jgi:hypothetical protein
VVGVVKKLVGVAKKLVGVGDCSFDRGSDKSHPAGVSNSLLPCGCCMCAVVWEVRKFVCRMQSVRPVSCRAETRVRDFLSRLRSVSSKSRPCRSSLRASLTCQRRGAESTEVMQDMLKPSIALLFVGVQCGIGMNVCS